MVSVCLSQFTHTKEKLYVIAKPDKKTIRYDLAKDWVSEIEVDGHATTRDG